MPVRAIDHDAHTVRFACTGTFRDGETRCTYVNAALPLDAARVETTREGTGVVAITCPACGSVEYFHPRLTQAHVDEATAQATTHRDAATGHEAQAAAHREQATTHRTESARHRKLARGAKSETKRAEHEAHAATHTALATDHATHAARHDAMAGHHHERAAACADRAVQVHHARLLSIHLGVQHG